MEMDTNEKLILKLREDVETRPIEVIVQLASVSKEEQVFEETVLQIDAISENNVEETSNFTRKLQRTNQILLEQSKDHVLLQLKLKAKFQKEEHPEEILQ